MEVGSDDDGVEVVRECLAMSIRLLCQASEATNELSGGARQLNGLSMYEYLLISEWMGI